MEVGEQIFVSSAPARTPRVPRFPSRPESAGWAATTSDRAETLRRMTVAPLVLETAGGQRRRLAGLELLLDWLEAQPGEDWQQRWLASGAEAGGRYWRAAPAAWLGAHGVHSAAGLQALCAAVPIAICADVIRPGLGWFVSSVMRGGSFVRTMADARDAPGFTRALQECTRDERVSEEVTTHVLYRAAVILGAKGGLLSDIIVGDVLELLDTEASARASMMAHGSDLYRLLH